MLTTNGGRLREATRGITSNSVGRGMKAISAIDQRNRSRIVVESKLYTASRTAL
jgi:hypothetical protein